VTTLPATRPPEHEPPTPTPGYAEARGVCPLAAPGQRLAVGPVPTLRVEASLPRPVPERNDVALGLLAGERRTWSPWRVRLSYAVALLLVGVPVIVVLNWLRTFTHPGHSVPVEVVEVASFVWIVLAIPVVLNVIGALTFRRGSEHASETLPIDVPVFFRIVTRGTNVEAVLKTVDATIAVMDELPLFPYVVEVVTDVALPFDERTHVHMIVVPHEYRTDADTKFKARALNYALGASIAPDSAWLFHLDEETHITPSVVRGIRNSIMDEETSGQLRIGQGVVLYHRDLRHHPFLTLADSIRTGDDLGRFRLQHQFGQSAFGLHGSFILVRNDVEKEVGFDLGPSGSVTEDAWWSLVEMANGRRSRWVDGYCLEQSTQSILDFVKQRRRWFMGLCLVCMRAPAHLRHRIALVTSVMLWGVGWLGWWIISIAAVITHAQIPFAVFLVGAISLSAYSALYVLGLELNLEQRGTPWYRRIPLHVLQVVLLPLFSLLEGSAVIYGLIRPDFAFHVVDK
jgi:egghead protein (zeste-white 4 protein)